MSNISALQANIRELLASHDIIVDTINHVDSKWYTYSSNDGKYTYGVVYVGKPDEAVIYASALTQEQFRLIKAHIALVA